MYYTIYEITNIKNGMKYIGKHITENIHDGYMGSGLYLKNAIKKYGKNAFRKEILFLFDCKADMENKERELVNENIIKNIRSSAEKKKTSQ
jgi:hypothetical protein